jgi:hypothetical protein
MRLLIVGGMLALAVSASMTAANAASGFPKFMCNGADTSHPGSIIAWGSAKPNCRAPPSWDGTRNNPWSCPPLLQACVAQCVKAKEAARH